MSLRLRATLAISLAMFGVFAADLLWHGPVTSIDPAISTWMHARMHPWLTQVLFAITHLHSTLGLSVMSAVVALFFAVKRRSAWIAWLLLTVQGGQVLNALVKDLFHRARPHWDAPLVELSSSSFPSGHAAGSTVFWGFVCVAAWSWPASPAVKRALAIVAPLMVGLTALSRVYLGAHYFSDVLAGIGEGLAWVCLCAIALGARMERAGR